MKKYRGFSLLEMAFVIMISGLIMASILNFIPILYKVSKTSLNEKKMERVENALYAYIARFKTLPKPANITLTINDEGFAVEDQEDNIETAGKDNFYIGMLPAVSLGLSPEYAYDAFNNKFIYIVRKSCTGSEGLKGCEGDKIIKIKTNDTITENPLFVIISQGSNKNYSFGANKSIQKEFSGSEEEQYNSYKYFINTDEDELIVYNKVYKNRNFDDKVIFATRDFVLSKLNMYDVGCKLNMKSTKIKNKVNELFNTDVDKLFSNLDNYHIDYKDTKQSNIYTISNEDGTSTNYRCIIECGSFGNINVYKVIVD